MTTVGAEGGAATMDGLAAAWVGAMAPFASATGAALGSATLLLFADLGCAVDFEFTVDAAGGADTGLAESLPAFALAAGAAADCLGAGFFTAGALTTGALTAFAVLLSFDAFGGALVATFALVVALGTALGGALVALGAGLGATFLAAGFAFFAVAFTTFLAAGLGAGLALVTFLAAGLVAGFFVTLLAALLVLAAFAAPAFAFFAVANYFSSRYAQCGRSEYIRMNMLITSICFYIGCTK
jgi:hypothetical protein